MIVVVLHKPRGRASGLLKHYLVEIDDNIFVGTVNAKMRGILEKKMEEYGQSALFIYNSDTVQGFAVDTTGDYKVEKYLNMVAGTRYE